MKLDERIQRDRQNAEFAIEMARFELTRLRPPQEPIDNRFGVAEHLKSRMDHHERSRAALNAIADEAFHVMEEVYSEVAGDKDGPVDMEQLWYANTNSQANEVLISKNWKPPSCAGETNPV